LALELLVVPFCDLFFLHGFSLFTLSFRVRKIRGGSNYRVKTPSGNLAKRFFNPKADELVLS
jgi:hypothetical protein